MVFTTQLSTGRTAWVENREICLGIQKGCILWREREGEEEGGGGRERGCYIGGGMGGEQGDLLGDPEGLHPLEGEGGVLYRGGGGGGGGGCRTGRYVWGSRRAASFGGGGRGRRGGATVAEGNGMEMCIELIQKS